MAKKADFRRERIRDVPEGVPWVPYRLDLAVSVAWRSRSVNCIRLIEFLLVEHMRHAGLENGQLGAAYSQLENAGIGRRFISAAISEAEALGLIRVERGGRKGRTATHMNRFRLTFLKSREVDDAGRPYFAVPTDEWKRVTADQAVAARGQRLGPKEQKRRAEGALIRCTKVNQTGSPFDTQPTSAQPLSAEKTKASLGEALVHEGEHPSISRVSGADAGRVNGSALLDGARVGQPLTTLRRGGRGDGGP